LGAVNMRMSYAAVEAKWKKFGKYMPGPDWSGWNFPL